MRCAFVWGRVEETIAVDWGENGPQNIQMAYDVVIFSAYLASFSRLSQSILSHTEKKNISINFLGLSAGLG